MVTIDQGLDAPAAQGRIQRLYFAVWRWHFYAALYVIPFLLMLATSGLIILWVTAISPEYGDFMTVAKGDKVLSLVDQEAAAIAAHPGSTVDKYIAPNRRDQARDLPRADGGRRDDGGAGPLYRQGRA